MPRLKRLPVVLTKHDKKRGASNLRYDAGLAYLDGRNARALDLNRKADKLDRAGSKS